MKNERAVRITVITITLVLFLSFLFACFATMVEAEAHAPDEFAPILLYPGEYEIYYHTYYETYFRFIHTNFINYTCYYELDRWSNGEWVFLYQDDIYAPGLMEETLVMPRRYCSFLYGWGTLQISSTQDKFLAPDPSSELTYCPMISWGFDSQGE